MSDTTPNTASTPGSDADSASGAAAAPLRDDGTGPSTSATDEAATDDDGTPVENPSG